MIVFFLRRGRRGWKGSCRKSVGQKRKAQCLGVRDLNFVELILIVVTHAKEEAVIHEGASGNVKALEVPLGLASINRELTLMDLALEGLDDINT